MENELNNDFINLDSIVSHCFRSIIKQDNKYLLYYQILHIYISSNFKYYYFVKYMQIYLYFQQFELKYKTLTFTNHQYTILVFRKMILDLIDDLPTLVITSEVITVSKMSSRSSNVQHQMQIKNRYAETNKCEESKTPIS